MKRVFVVNEPVAYGGNRIFNVRPALQYGEIVYVFPPGQPALDPASFRTVTQRVLNDFDSNDYLLPIGNSACIVAAAAVAARRTNGRINVLLWDRDRRGYDLIELKLWDEPRGDGIAKTVENRV